MKSSEHTSDFILTAEKTALVIIDLQHGLAVMPVAPRTFDEVVDRTAHLAESFRQKKSHVIWVRFDFHNFRRLVVDQAMIDPNAPPFPPESVEIVPEAGKRPDELLITKRFWGAFDTTTLEAELHKRGVDTIVLCGISTDIGVESTARSAATLGFNVVVAEDATSARNMETHLNAIEQIFPFLGRVRSASQIEAALV